MKEKKTIKNGYIGKLDEENPFFIYCNEKEYTKGKFLFKCCGGCKHNPLIK